MPSIEDHLARINAFVCNKEKTMEEEKKIEEIHSGQKEVKFVKGVEENIFEEKFKQLFGFLDTLDDEHSFFIIGRKKAQYYKHDRKTKRRSGYRGVSRNGASWQVLMMINNCKTYIGCYDTEEEGALVYDIVSILFKKRKARTNLSYSKTKLLTLLAYYDQSTKHFKEYIPQQFTEELKMLIDK
jgi:hypothetical protein